MTRPVSSKRQWLYLSPIFLVTVGLLLFIVNAIWRADAATSWPTVEAQIVSSTPGLSAGRYQRPGIALRYTYAVDGHDYVGERFQDTAKPGTPEQVRQVAAYAVGNKLTVYLNPRDPSDALLEPGVPLIYWLALVLPLGALALFFVRLVLPSLRRG